MTSPKVGDKITAIVKGELAKVLLVDGPLSQTWNVRIYRERKISGATYPIKKLWTIATAPKDEGVTWARGWDTEASGALRSSIALERSR